MTLLAPWQALVALSVAGPVLVALYMLKLRRRPVVVSATAFWEQAVRDLEVNVPLRWLRPSWLLALQAAALGLLVAALGRPALTGGGTAAAHVVLVIDRSASMGASDAARGGTRLEEASRRAMQRVDRLARSGFGGEVTVIAFGARAERLAGPTSDLRLARDAIERIEPTDETGAPGAAFELGAAMLARDASGGAGDGPARGVRDDVAGAVVSGAVVELYADAWPSEALLSPAPVRFERVGPGIGAEGVPAVENAGIAAISARRGFDDPSVVRVFVRVVGVGGVRAFPLVLRADGRELERRAVSLGAAGAGEEHRVREASVTFELVESGPVVVEAAIDRPDSLGSDDRAWVAVHGAARPSIVLVQDGDAPAPSEGAWMLVEVLRELRPSALVSMSVSRFDALGSAAWDGADLVVFLDSSPAVLPGRATLHFGASHTGLGVDAERFDAGEGSSGGALRGVVSWSREHALLRSVSLDALRFRGGSRLVAGAAWARLADASGGAVMLAGEVGERRRVVVGFGLGASNWPALVSFPLFVANAVEWLTLSGDATAGSSVRAGETAELGVGVAPQGAATVRLMGADGDLARARLQSDGARASIGVVPRAGLYRLEFADAEGRALSAAGSGAPAVLAVNVASERESAIAVVERPEAMDAAGDGDRGSGVAVGEGELREVWWWFVLAAAVLGTVEWVVYAVRVRL